MKNVLLILCLFPNFLDNNLGRHQLSIAEVERILGEPVTLANRENTKDTLVFTTKSTFSAKDTSGKANLYYMFEQYNQVSSAEKTYNTFYESNKKSIGFETLKGYGDAAFFHSDKHNFCLLIIRKEHKLIRLKVNKMTSKTSIEAVKKVGKDLMGRL